jgi:hypothetical protein
VVVGELPGDVRQEAIELSLDYFVTLADSGLQAGAIEYGDLATLVAN